MNEGLKSEIDRLRPWMYEFELPDGSVTPIMHSSLKAVHAVRRSMIMNLVEAMGLEESASVLDLACNEGFFTTEFARRGARSAFGIDIRPTNIEKAELIRNASNLGNCNFEVDDIMTSDLSTRAADIVLLLGIIYHVEDPIRLMRRAAQATRRIIFVETQLTKPTTPVEFGWGPLEGFATRDLFAIHRENQPSNALASSAGLSLVPSVSAVVTILRDIGFRNILQLHPSTEVSERQYDELDRAVFAATW